MTTLHIILAAAAVWRITHLLQLEDGPFAIFERARGRLRHASLAGPVDCFYCLSLWVAAPFALALTASSGEFILAVFALSASAIFINTFVVHHGGRAFYFEEPDRKEKPLCPAVEVHATQESSQPVYCPHITS